MFLSVVLTFLGGCSGFGGRKPGGGRIRHESSRGRKTKRRALYRRVMATYAIIHDRINRPWPVRYDGAAAILRRRYDGSAFMQQKIIERVRTLRAELHSLAELSGQEHKTKAHLVKFLQQNTTLQIDDRGAWFCALHQEPSARETIAFRADMDAVGCRRRRRASVRA